MNRIAILIATILLALSGCAKDKEECRHGSATINTEAKELTVDPETVRVRQGCTIELRIVPPREVVGDVTIKHEEFPIGAPEAIRWLDKTNADSKELIVIEVPEDAVLGEHKYSVTIPGFEILDPFANVIPH